MLNLGLPEILLIMILALVIIGPERLPEVIRYVGRMYGKLMRTSNELRRAFMLEAERSDIEKRAEAMRQRREEARARIAAEREKAAANDTPDPDVAAVGTLDNPFGAQPPHAPNDFHAPVSPKPAPEAAETSEAEQ